MALLSLAAMRPRARNMVAAVALTTLPAPSISGAICPSILAGSCYVVDGGTVSAGSAASAYGHSVQCSARCQAAGGATLILRDDRTYSAPPSTATFECRPGVAIAVPDEEGPIREKRGKLILEPSNLSELDAILDTCAEREIVVRRYRTTLRIAADGATLTGVSKLRTVAPGRIPVTTRVVERFTATRVPTAHPALAPSVSRRARALPACSPDLEPRCVTD